MAFNTFQFILLFPWLFLLYYAIPQKWQQTRNLYLLVVSYSLYIQWKPVYALVLLFVTFVTFGAAWLLGRTEKRKAITIAGCVVALSPLLAFKYFNFVNEVISDALAWVGINCQPVGLNWAIPVGISFFTLQAIGYLVDVYLYRVKAERDFLTYALFISFFPSILTGPINKASLVIPQLKSLRPYFDYEKVVEGTRMLLWGMFMKVVVADRLAIYVISVLDHYDRYNGTTCFMASFFYTMQIYADFAGYSLMAIGVGKTLGFELTENFRRPYFSVSVTDFWRRWHISLSTWLKDYIYIPLGGSRCSKARNYLNIIVTFLVSGIWHGANWTFIFWGLLHGVTQAFEKMIGQQGCRYTGMGKFVKIFVTFVFINFSWIFFRMPTLQDAFNVVGRIFDFSQPMGWDINGENINTLFFSAIGIAMLFAKDYIDEFTNIKIFDHHRLVVRWLAYSIVLSSILLTGVFGSDQFIYANF